MVLLVLPSSFFPLWDKLGSGSPQFLTLSYSSNFGERKTQTLTLEPIAFYFFTGIHRLNVKKISVSTLWGSIFSELDVLPLLLELHSIQYEEQTTDYSLRCIHICMFAHENGNWYWDIASVMLKRNVISLSCLAYV